MITRIGKISLTRDTEEKRKQSPIFREGLTRDENERLIMRTVERRKELDTSFNVERPNIKKNIVLSP